MYMEGIVNLVQRAMSTVNSCTFNSIHLIHSMSNSPNALSCIP